MALTYEQFKELMKTPPEKRQRDLEPDWIDRLGDETEAHPIINPRYRRGK